MLKGPKDQFHNTDFEGFKGSNLCCSGGRFHSVASLGAWSFLIALKIVQTIFLESSTSQ